MKKFIVCILFGYALIFVVYSSLPRFSEHGRKYARSARDVSTATALSEKKRAEEPSSLKGIRKPAAPALAVPPLHRDKNFEKPTASGPVETFYRSGKLSSEWTQQAGGKGVFKTYTPEGKLWMEMPFAAKRPEGVVKTYDPDGGIFCEETFVAGRKKGMSVWYYPDGSPWLKLEHQAQGGIRLAELYSQNGQRADHPPANSGQSSGYFKAYDASGHEVMNWQQAAGEQQTVLKSYYQGGAVSSEWGFKNAQLNGRGIFYYPDGEIRMEMEFKEGKLSGRTLVSSPDGNRMLEQRVLTEPAAGEETRAYYPDGKIFWILKKTEAKDGPPVFHLQTFWQSDTPEKTAKEILTLEKSKGETG